MDYSDKRDIGTLEYQMTTMCQDQRTITEFYQAVYQYLSLILDNIACLDLDESSLFAMPRSYRDKALNTFVRGLKRDLPMLLSSKETASLSQALHICLKLDNTSYRMTMLMDKLQGQIKKFEVAEIKQSIQTFIQRKVTLDSPRLPPKPIHQTFNGQNQPRNYTSQNPRYQNNFYNQQPCQPRSYFPPHTGFQNNVTKNQEI